MREKGRQEEKKHFSLSRSLLRRGQADFCGQADLALIPKRDLAASSVVEIQENGILLFFLVLVEKSAANEKKRKEKVI